MPGKAFFLIIIFIGCSFARLADADANALAQYTLFGEAVIPGEHLIDPGQLPHSRYIGLLVSGGNNQGFRRAVQSNHRAFARARGIPYEYHLSDANKYRLEFSDEPGIFMFPYYYKIPLLLDLLFGGQVEEGKYIVYIDDDVVMNDFDPEYPPMFDRVIAAFPEASVILTRDVFSGPWLNNGIMIFKKNDFSRELVDQWWAIRPKTAEQQAGIAYLDQGLLRQLIEQDPLFRGSPALRLITPRQGDLNLNTFRHSHCDWYNGTNIDSLTHCYPGVEFPDGFAAKTDASIHHPGLSAISKHEEITKTLKLVESHYPLTPNATTPQQIHEILEERRRKKTLWRAEHKKTIAWEQWRNQHFTLMKTLAEQKDDAPVDIEPLMPEKPDTLKQLPQKLSQVNGYRRLENYLILSKPLTLNPGSVLDCQGNILFMNTSGQEVTPYDTPAVVEMKAYSQLINCVIVGGGAHTGIKVQGRDALIRDVVIRDVDYGLDLSRPLPADTFPVSEIQFYSRRNDDSALIYRVRIINPRRGYTYPGRIPQEGVTGFRTGSVPGCHHQLVNVKGISGMNPDQPVLLPFIMEQADGFADVLMFNAKHPPQWQKLSGNIAELTFCNIHNTRMDNIQVHSDLDYPFRLYHSERSSLSGLNITGNQGGLWLQHVNELDFGDSRVRAGRYAVMAFGVRASTLHHLDLQSADDGFGLWLSGGHFTHVRDSRVGRFHTDHRDANASYWFYNNQLVYPGEEHIAATHFRGPARFYKKRLNGAFGFPAFTIGNEWQHLTCTTSESFNQHQVCVDPGQTGLAEVDDIYPLASYPKDVSAGLIKEAGHYRLTGDRSFPYGLVINGDNVTLDCMGFKIASGQPQSYPALTINRGNVLLYNCFFESGGIISGIFPPQYIIEPHHYKELPDDHWPVWQGTRSKINVSYHPPRLYTDLISPVEGLYRKGGRLILRHYQMHYTEEVPAENETVLMPDFDVPLAIVFLYPDYALNHQRGMGAAVRIIE